MSVLTKAQTPDSFNNTVNPVIVEIRPDAYYDLRGGKVGLILSLSGEEAPPRLVEELEHRLGALSGEELAKFTTIHFLKTPNGGMLVAAKDYGLGLRIDNSTNIITPISPERRALYPISAMVS